MESTLASMTLDEKIGQLFCVTDMITDPEALKAFVQKYHIGGFMYRSGDPAEVQTVHRAMQEASKIPLLLACNLESGGNGIATNGTFFGRQMEVAAAQDKKMPTASAWSARKRVRRRAATGPSPPSWISTITGGIPSQTCAPGVQIRTP